MYQPNCHPALVSDTLVITSQLDYKSTKYYCGHGASESRSLLVCKETDIKNLIFHPGSEDAQNNILRYFQLRKRLGIPFTIHRITFSPLADATLIPEFKALGYNVVVEELPTE